MGTALWGGEQSDVEVVGVPVVHTRRTFADDWEPRMDLEVITCMVASAEAGGGQATLARRYGSVKQPWESAFDDVVVEDLDGLLVRISIWRDCGMVPVFYGRIAGEGRAMAGDSPTSTGRQEWVCYDGLRDLERICVSTSFWDAGAGAVKELGWSPGFNLRDDLNTLAGNRTASKHGETYVFGGRSTWTRRNVVEYLLVRFADRSSQDGAAWLLTGAVDELDQEGDAFSLRHEASCADIIRSCISPAAGMDFVVQGHDAGYDLFVFSLSTRPIGERESAKRQIVIDPSDRRVERCSCVRTSERRYDKIRVIGQRAVVCCSLKGARVPSGGGSLVRQWSLDLEAEYRAGTGNSLDAAEEHDAARKDDRFRCVFSRLAAPEDWDRASAGVNLAFSADGVRDPAGGDYQTTAISTLRWTPLLEHYDYSGGSEAAYDSDAVQSDLLPPAVWLYDERDGRWVLADEAGVAVSVLQHALGVQLSASPNHLLAYNWWGGAAVTLEEPRYDYRMTIATLAFECDWRQVLEVETNDGLNDGSVLVIEVPNAEYWWVAPGTITALVDGYLISEVPNGLTLRNDISRLRFTMDGALARYHQTRRRVEAVYRGLLPMSALVGSVVEPTGQGSATADLAAVVTAVEYMCGTETRTVLRAGYA